MCCEYLHSSADETKLHEFIVAYKTMRSLNPNILIEFKAVFNAYRIGGSAILDFMLLCRTQDLKHSNGIILINITAFQNFHCCNFNSKYMDRKSFLTMSYSTILLHVLLSETHHLCITVL